MHNENRDLAVHGNKTRPVWCPTGRYFSAGP